MLSKFILAIITLPLLTACSSTNPYYSKHKFHHSKEGFRNQHIAAKYSPTPRDYMRWITGYGVKKLKDMCWNDDNDEATTVCHDKKIFKPQNTTPLDLDRIYHPPPDKIQVTWIGHSTLLIQVDGMAILTDPIFSRRASPIQLMGPKRIADLPIRAKQLPPIDAVIVSHNHYDHLDLGSLKDLGNRPHYFVPLGNKQLLKSVGINKITELDWWDQASIGSLKFNLVPAQHFSGRGLFDYNQSLWGGFVIESKLGNMFFAGDTGYSPDIKDIGLYYSPIKLAFLPIGAYQPRWNNYLVHANPHDAIMMHKDLKSQNSVAIHWGTFNFTEEPLSEPKTRLKEELWANNIPTKQFTTMKIGETQRF